MGIGYTRQSAADIVAGEEITAGPLNAEFNQLENAFDDTTGHSHDGTAGEGPKIDLTTSIAGVLPVARGGFGGIHNTSAITDPGVGDDTADGYAVGSLWVNTSTDKAFIATDITLGAAVWKSLTEVTDAELLAIAGLTSAADKGIYFTGSGTAALFDLPSYGRTLVNSANATAARATLGVVINSDVQAYDAELAALAGLTSAADKGIMFSGSGTAATYDLTSFARTLLDDANAGAALTTLGLSAFIQTLIDDADATTAQATLGLVIGTNVQAYDADLAALAGLTSAADKGIMFSGAGTAATYDLSSFARTFLDDANAGAVRTTLGVAIGSNVQAWDADLDAIAALSGTNTIYYRSAANTWTAVTIGSGLTFSAGTLDAAALSDAELTAIAGLVSAADRLPYFTGSGTASLATFTAFGRSLVDDADASAGRTTLGLGTIATFDEATTAQYLNNTADKALSTDQVNAAGAIFGLTDAATIAWDMASGFNASVTLGGNRTLGNPTNTIVGRTGAIVVTQDGTGSRTLAYGTSWEAAGGSFPVLSTAAGTKDIIFYWIQSSTSIIITGILKAVA